MSVPWNEFLTAVMDAPDETQKVEVTWGNRRVGGGSPGNPYLPKPKPTTYSATISPAAVGQHLLVIREQLANEWKQDLQLLPLCNAELRRHRSEQVAHLCDEQEKLQYAIAPSHVEGEEGMNGSPLRSASSTGSRRRSTPPSGSRASPNNTAPPSAAASAAGAPGATSCSH